MPDIVDSLISAVIGGVLVAVVTYLLNRGRTKAEIDKLRAERDKLRAETAQIELSISEVKAGQTRQESAINEIQAFLVKHFLTPAECAHLEHLASGEPWPFRQDATTSFFLNELRNLRSMGLIEGHPGKGIRSLQKEGGDVKDHFRIRPEGREFLRLLHDSQGG